MDYVLNTFTIKLNTITNEFGTAHFTGEIPGLAGSSRDIELTLPIDNLYNMFRLFAMRDRATNIFYNINTKEFTFATGLRN